MSNNGQNDKWITPELQEALDALPTSKHRTTVLRLAEAELIERSEEETFKLKDVCAKKTWHGPYRDGRRYEGWKDDPRVQKALAIAQRLVRTQRDAEVVAFIKQAEKCLAGAAPKAVLFLEELVMNEEASDEVRRKAANDILDRVYTTTSRIARSEQVKREITFDLSKIPMEVLEDLA